ncbi:hypothetical protein NDU88_005431 [Pleurodeles waltl]|uniref:Uncharacterized protein n=1 Tax=Pleurodeles waltl TaxID=8319 RepID=A0AAV7W7T6_PLEWA|nr:hypothetical protein NDU88_005431 [Pleurodeles waltl]
MWVYGLAGTSDCRPRPSSGTKSGRRGADPQNRRGAWDSGRRVDAAVQDSQKLDTVLAAVEHIGDSLERARSSLEAKIDRVASDLVLLHADHRNLADKTEAAWDWLESTGREAERHPSGSKNKHSWVWHGRRRGVVTAEAAAHAPDLEQLIQERREALQSAVAICASPRVSELETEISQPPSDRPATPDRLSELGFLDCPTVNPATADDLFQALL